MSLRRLLVLLLLVLAPIPIAAAEPAWACSCAGPADTDRARAEVAFVGVVQSVRPAAAGRQVAFAVESVARGAVGSIVTLTTSDDETSCGYSFEPGGRYRIYAQDGSTSLCSGNELLTAGVGHRERVERAAAYRSMVFWAGSGLIFLAVAGGVAWVLRLPGGRVAAVSGQPVAPDSRDVRAGRTRKGLDQ
ncbi:hypothetical protein AB0F81_20060 [Actinoplanes sp. NPDC024001]|uniref:hypothetical protein n=1 Tax=Actinoplanes sp. NPDC024001 TaxID=3154598 RepID=UPI0033DE551E